MKKAMLGVFFASLLTVSSNVRAKGVREYFEQKLDYIKTERVKSGLMALGIVTVGSATAFLIYDIKNDCKYLKSIGFFATKNGVRIMEKVKKHPYKAATIIATALFVGTVSGEAIFGGEKSRVRMGIKNGWDKLPSFRKKISK